ncbi:MAG TPA: hypothetical protein VG602_04750 [Actinomycetota bacterium]|nr:hypothetical protein [Actinomycetota bacterium]
MGIPLVVGSGVLGLLTVFVLRRRAAAPVVGALLAMAGVGLGWGAMLLQPDPSPFEVVAAMAILAVLVPMHVRFVLGPFGPSSPTP